MLEKSEISLRSLEKEDVDFLLNLENDTSIWEVSRTVAPFTKEEIADYILTKSNTELKIDFPDNSNEPFESKKLRIDSSKAYVNLNWKNIYTIDDALLETITWYKTYQSKQKDMKEFSISQIDNYVSKAKQVNMNWTK